MSILERVAEAWLGWVVAVSWQLALLVCIVAVVCRLARGVSPRLRSALWLLVLAKVFLPPGLTAPWSLGEWGVAPALARAQWLAPTSPRVELPAPDAEPLQPDAVAAATRSPWLAAWNPSLAEVLLIAWAAGALAFWAMAGWGYARLTRAIRSARVIDEGPDRVAFERIALELGVRRVPELLGTRIASGPFLLGVIWPRVVLPEASLEELSEPELRAVLTHELVHWRRGDTWIGCVQVAVQSMFWFHPFIWWAGRQLRHERECACDQAVLDLGHIAPREYGESIFRVLTAARGRSVVAGSLVGVYEPGTRLQDRLESIMNYEPNHRRFGWLSRAALVAFATLFLPMAPRVVDTGPATARAGDRAVAAADAPYPQIVKTVPEIGATDVSPELGEITVTFDRDMGQGMSWTGGPPLFPPVDEARKPRWTDARTCVLPVTLAKGSYYRLGINSTDYQNFKSTNGTPAFPSAIYFATQGASPAVAGRVRRPEVVSLSPKNGAVDVDPKTKVLRVKFNMPMDSGMSWTGNGPDFPESADGEEPKWSPDGRTCSLPVVLEADRDYQLGLNDAASINFNSKWGVPLAPVEYKFHTRPTGK